jgi:hypothetical protein
MRDVFIRRYAVTPANIHGKQMLPILRHPGKTDNGHLEKSKSQAIEAMTGL